LKKREKKIASKRKLIIQYLRKRKGYNKERREIFYKKVSFERD